ncbi:MAG: radical SAM family heme chaperone HemW [Acidimicrobiia bacterium]|nr:radical SAM family heme chaperone HemW [Acidimicrobiia bacterium]NNC74913.1 radical SAM family heme chaperone HemW [Acidimicrobiia bacterium]
MTLRPDSPELADGAASWLSAYVHIPFCTRRCPYCDFAVVTPIETAVSHRAYIDALVVEINLVPDWGPLDAVSVGGGTPSLVDPELLGEVTRALDRRFGFRDDAEVALEANPEDWSPDRAAGLVAAGFRRVSFGAQSFDPDVLAALGRGHTPDDIGAAVAVARNAGFTSINLDLIFGTSGESKRSWEDSVDRAINLGVDHVSTYALTVERGTRLSKDILAGAPAPDPDDQADKYESAQHRLTEAGFVQYEVSNFAMEGHHVRYNLCTWAGGEYLGIGLGAHEHRDGVRARNLRRLDRYMEAVGERIRPRSGSETVNDREQEAAFLGLRRMAGVPLNATIEDFLGSDSGVRLAAAGVIAVDEGRLRISRPLLADAVMREFVG